jgi:hypothetical protein
MTRFAIPTWPFLVSLAVFGCGATPDEIGRANAGGHEEEVGTIGQEIKTCRRGTEIIKGQWQAGDPTKAIAPVSTHVCALHRVQGSFRGSGESVWVSRDANNWLMGGTSQQPGVNSVAWCVERACFTKPFGDSISGGFEAESSAFRGLCGFTGTDDTVTGDWATMLTGVKGRLDSRGDHAYIDQDMFGDEKSYLNAQACGVSYLNASAYAYFAGRPRQPNKFWQLNGQKEFFADAWNGPRTLTLARADEAYCYLSDISGRFVVPGDRIDLAPVSTGGVMSWRLDVTYGSLDSQDQAPRAGARCMYYNQ